MWCPKNKDTGEIYPVKFFDVYDCQKYIDTELKEELEKANNLYRQKLLSQGKLPIFFCNRILCWNIGQRRFCDGFDF